MSEEVARSGSWADVVGEGRLPLFALICLGVWLSAADALVSATIMPSVGADLGGYAYFGWATAGFLLGSVLAGASSGLLAMRFGLRRATAAAAVLYALGCGLSAAAPDISSFLAGRLLQGLGGGWVAGFCSVAIGLLFPDRLLPRVYAAITGVWGIATLVGPLIGGLFADAGAWRGVFWLFAVQALAMGGAAMAMLPRDQRGDGASAVAWPQLGLIAGGVAAIGAADLAGDFLSSILLTGLGLALLLAMTALDARATSRLLPRGSGDLRTIPGAGFATMFLMTAASMGFSVYGPAILQRLYGLSALTAGYVVGIEALGWTTAALLVTHLTGAWPGRLIRLGPGLALAGVALSVGAFPAWGAAAAGAAGAVLGAGFGFSWSFMSQRILTALPAEERAIGAAGFMPPIFAIPTATSSTPL